MPPKRRLSSSDAAGGAAAAAPRSVRRRAELRASRRIDSAGAAPTPAVVRAVSATAAAQLPAQLDVASQLAAHETQISALQRAMKTARAGASTRAWQSLPRAERRRAASHNLLALPARLRARGRAEMAASTTTPRSRSETRKRLGAAGKNGGYPRTNERERRAEMAGRAGKPKARWLETHLWHAKRFRMSGTEPKIVRHGSDTHGGSDAAPHRWGFSLAEEPHMKGHRAAARTVSSGAAVHDASYTVSLRLSAHAASGLEAEAALKEALRGAGVGDAGHRDRATDSVLLGGPSRTALQAPVRVLWVSSDAAAETPKPQEPVASQAELAEPHLSDKALGKRRASVEADIEVGHAAEVILLIHPAGLASLQSALELSLAALDSPSSHLSLQVLESASPEVCVRSESKGRKHGGAKKAAVPRVRAAAGDAQKRKAVEQQRQQGYNVFELCGPHCGRVLGGVLQPLSSTSAEKRQAFKLVTRHVTPAQVRPGTMLALDVHDPRIFFPPKNVKRTDLTERERKQLAQGLSVLSGEEEQAEVPRILASGRLLSEGAPEPRVAKGELDSQRAKNLVPGRRITPTSTSDIVPILLIARAHPTAGWTLLVPRGWARAFWLSLVHSKSVVLSQLSLAHANLEAARPAFPADWVGTAAHARLAKEEATRERERWERTPPAKRIAWESVGTRWPWGGDGLWQAVCGLENAAQESTLDASPSKPKPWLLAHPDLAPAHPMDAAALLPITISAARRGNFGQHAELHLPSARERQAWLAALAACAREEGTEEKSGRETLQSLEQDTRASSLCGATTRGTFVLANGHAAALGCISLRAWRELCAAAAAGISLSSSASAGGGSEANQRLEPAQRHLVLVRERSGGVWRAAWLALALIQ